MLLLYSWIIGILMYWMLPCSLHWAFEMMQSLLCTLYLHFPVRRKAKKEMQPYEVQRFKEEPLVIWWWPGYHTSIFGQGSSIGHLLVRRANGISVESLSSTAVGCFLGRLSPPPLRYTAANHTRLLWKGAYGCSVFVLSSSLSHTHAHSISVTLCIRIICASKWMYSWLLVFTHTHLCDWESIANYSL